MHRKFLNAARLLVRIAPRGPLLIKSGLETPDPSRTGLEFVRTRHGSLGETVYLPGSSLKGVLRSHAERALRGLGLFACDPFPDRTEKDSSGPPQPPSRFQCHQGRKKTEKTSAVFDRVCPICRTFGSLQVRGRANIADVYPFDPRTSREEQEQSLALANRTESRTQVSIDRQTGAANSGKLFELEVVATGAFWGEIHLADFELGQLALLLACLDDLNRGYAAVGFGKSRGFGQVSAQVEALEFESAGSAPGALLGAAALLDADAAREYGLFSVPANDRLELPAGIALGRTWRGARLEVSGEELEVLTSALRGSCLESYLKLLPPEVAK